MKILLLLNLLICANAQSRDFVLGKIWHIGKYDAHVEIGNLTERYTNMTDIDLKSSLNARNLVEEARRMFRVGFHTLHPLDPYRRASMPNLTIDNDFDILRGEISFNNLIITGGIRFRLHLLEIRLQTGRIDYELTIPQLRLKVDVKTNLELAQLLPVKESGQLSVDLRNISVVGAVAVKSVQYNDSKIYQFVAQHIRVHIELLSLLFENKKQDSNVQGVLRSAGKTVNVHSDAYARLERHINKYVANIILKDSNQILTGATVEQVLAYLVPEHVTY